MLTENKKKRTTEIPTSSLADIAFLLLIFFLVTTTIDTDKGLSLALPPKGETKEVSKKNIAKLFINASGQILLDDQVVEIGMVKELVKQKLGANPNLIFSVKTARETKYKDYIRVIDKLKQANASRISIAEPEG